MNLKSIFRKTFVTFLRAYVQILFSFTAIVFW